MVNRVVLVGRLVKTIDLKKTKTETAYAVFTIAVDNRMKDNNGERGTLFIDCRIFGAQAESMYKNTRTGSKIAVDGSLNQRNYEIDGKKGRKIEVIVDSVTFLDSAPKKKDDEEEINDTTPFEEEPIDSPIESNIDTGLLPDDDLPF